jgi:hypothetical protein
MRVIEALSVMNATRRISVRETGHTRGKAS